VAPDSPAARVGVRAGDTLASVNGMPVASFADVQYALHRAPARGHVPISWRHDGRTRTADLNLAEGWRKTNLTWRPSMLDLLPSLSLSGEDLTAAEKRALGLSAKRLAFRQDKIVHSSVRAAGVRGGDVVLGIDGQPLEMTVDQFLAHVRKNYLVGDRVTLNILREGKRLDLPLKLR
jgi:serine protease Do